MIRLHREELDRAKVHFQHALARLDDLGGLFAKYEIAAQASVPITSDIFAHVLPRERGTRLALVKIAQLGLALEPGMRITRSFVYEGVEGVIENGVSRDPLKAGMANLIPASDPRAEKFVLANAHITLLINLIGAEALVDRGLV